MDDVKLERYSFSDHCKRIDVLEYHWVRKKGAPAGLPALSKTYEIGGVHFCEEGWIPQAAQEKYYKPGVPKKRRVCEFDVLILWALAACPKKTLACLESELAGREITKGGERITYVLDRSDIIDSLRRLENLGVIHKFSDLPTERGKRNATAESARQPHYRHARSRAR